MKKLLLATVASAAMATAVSADDVKIGVFLGFTGPIESLVAQMGPGAEAAAGRGGGDLRFSRGRVQELDVRDVQRDARRALGRSREGPAFGRGSPSRKATVLLTNIRCCSSSVIVRSPSPAGQVCGP